MQPSSSLGQFKLFDEGEVMVDLDLALHTLHLEHMVPLVDDAIRFLNKTPIRTLPPPQFSGAGVYVLYYHGDYEAYARISTANREECEQPIYVGKAVPKGRRTGRTQSSRGTELYSRLRKHSTSIEQASNLKVDDFECQFVVLEGVESDLIVPVESELIRRHEPLWNTCIAGFGINAPGKGRSGQRPSQWDTLHPGRYYAEYLTGAARQLNELETKVREHLEGYG